MNSNIELSENFPGHSKATVFLETLIFENNIQNVADIGGGANPLLSEKFVKKRHLNYTLLDISQEELDKSPSNYTQKIQMDATVNLVDFSKSIDEGAYELVFTHMFLEHIEFPLKLHKNVFHFLKTGGYAVHMYPSPCNFPLTINRLLPDFLSKILVRIAQPDRDLVGFKGKFKAYYKLCGNPSLKLKRAFEEIGYEVITHKAYIGHCYYDRYLLTRYMERMLRPILLKLGIPMTSLVFLMLKKP